MAEFELEKDALGRLVYEKDGSSHIVVPVRAFPLTAPEKGIALVSQEGRELAWIAAMDTLPETLRRLIEDHLRQREFLPEIVRINHIEGSSMPNHWDVETDRGNTSFRLRSEDDIRRIGPAMAIVSSDAGVNFLIRNLSGLDRHSKHLLMRFLS